ncbi:hypothetical protein MMC07_002751 [Pseudocyphellaria aurata]|nr:hypothetical protein [Pseudocyphellaria aurata]
MRTIFLLALLSGIYAHPLGGDHGIEFSHEKRCGDFSCPIIKPLPYPAGFSRRNCRDVSRGRNLFGNGLSVAGTKRSIFPITPTHTENTDRLSLLQSRVNRCREITLAGRTTNFPGPIGNTNEVALRAQAVYAFSWTFDSRVRHLSLWVRRPGSTDFTKLKTISPGTTEGLMLFQAETSFEPLVHFWFDFDYNQDWAQAFSAAPDLQINGFFTLFQLE